MATKPSFKDVIRKTTDLSIKKRHKLAELKTLSEAWERRTGGGMHTVSQKVAPALQKKILKLATEINKYQSEIDRLDDLYRGGGLY